MKRRGGKYHHGALAQDALESTAREIDAHGHQGFTLDKVAKRLGVTAAALYRHYDGRDALLKAFVVDGFKRFVVELEADVTAAPSPRETLLALGRGNTRFALRNPGWFRLQFSKAGIALGIKHEEEAELRYPPLMMTAIAALIGTTDNETVMRVYLTLWALSHGVASLLIEDVWLHLTTDEARMRYADEVFAGYVDRLAPAPAARAARAARARKATKRARK